jgi:hypothetical protein
MAQNLIVALLVLACFAYVLWTLGPKSPRGRLAAVLMKLPLPTVLQRPLVQAMRQQGGCGSCGGCSGGSSAAVKSTVQSSESPAIQASFQSLTFVPGNYTKKSLR